MHCLFFIQMWKIDHSKNFLYFFFLLCSGTCTIWDLYTKSGSFSALSKFLIYFKKLKNKFFKVLSLFIFCFFIQSHSKDLEDSSVEETGAVGVNKEGKTDPLDCGRYKKYRDCGGGRKIIPNLMLVLKKWGIFFAGNYIWVKCTLF